MEKHAALKRERMVDQSRRFYEEPEVSPTKKPLKETNVDYMSEILSKMDSEEQDLGIEEIGEEMMWDMMKMLDEEICPNPFSTDSYGTGTNSNDGCDELESTEGDKDGSFDGEQLDYLLGASDDELGSHCVNDYDSCGGFFEWQLEVERAQRQLLLQMMLGYGESVEDEGTGDDLFSVNDFHIVLQ